MLSPITLAINRESIAAAAWQNSLLCNFDDAANTLDSRITATRASSAMYRDSNGIWQTVGTDVIRAHAYQHYDEDTNEPQGLWSEGSRTNRALWCRDFTNAVWAKTNMTAALTATGIDGAANSASTITATAGNATVLQSRTLASSDNVTSCFVKRRTGSGTVEMTMDNGATWTAITVTGSWKRVRIPKQTLASPVFGFRIVTSGDAIDVDYFQQEDGVTVDAISSPILTTTASATRAADSITITGSNFTGFYNSTEGTLYAESRQPAPGTSSAAVGVSDGTFNNYMLIAVNVSTGSVSTFGDTSSVSQFNISLQSGYTGPEFVKTAMAYKVNDIQGAADGVASAVDTSATLPTVSRMSIARANTTANTTRFFGFVRRIAYYRTRLPEATLASITA